MAASLAMYAEVYGRDSYDDAGATVVVDGPLPARLRQRVLERRAAGLRRRRRQDLRPVHQAGRRARPRAHPRGHRAHRRAGLRGPVRGAQRVGLRRVRRLPQAAAARPGRRRGRLADRRRAVPARRAGAGAARHGPPRHGLRRPGAGQGPAARPHGRLRRHHRRPRRRPPQLRHPQPRLPARGHRDRRLGGRGRRPDLVRRPHRRVAEPQPTSPTFAAATVAAAGEHADAGRGGLAHRRRHPADRAPPARASRRPTTTPATARCGCGVPAASPGWSPTARSTSTPTTRRAPELAELVDRIDLREVAGGDPQPDMYVYAFDLCGDRATVPEQHLTADLRRVADLVLDRRRRDSP